jgi:hypothetical protein
MVVVEHGQEQIPNLYLYAHVYNANPIIQTNHYRTLSAIIPPSSPISSYQNPASPFVAGMTAVFFPFYLPSFFRQLINQLGRNIPPGQLSKDPTI